MKSASNRDILFFNFINLHHRHCNKDQTILFFSGSPQLSHNNKLTFPITKNEQWPRQNAAGKSHRVHNKKKINICVTLYEFTILLNWNEAILKDIFNLTHLTVPFNRRDSCLLLSFLTVIHCECLLFISNLNKQSIQNNKSRRGRGRQREIKVTKSDLNRLRCGHFRIC